MNGILRLVVADMLFALIRISLYNLPKSSNTVKLCNSESTSQLWLKHGTNSFMTAAVYYISADIQNVIGNHSYSLGTSHVSIQKPVV